MLLECLAKSRAPRETVARPQFDASITVEHARFTEASDRAVARRPTRGPSLPRDAGRNRRRDAFETAETESVEIALEPRALVRVAETYGVDAADLREAFATLRVADSDDHRETRTGEERETPEASDDALRAYVERLFAEGAHGPAVRLTTHFTLRCFASAATLRTLVANNQFDLAFSLAERVNRDARRELIRICGETNEHAGFRAAWHATRDFSLEDAFPLVKQRYFESTIARMVEKGQSEAALRYAGDDAQLRHAVVQRLIEAGDAVTAAEYAGRIGLDVGGGGDGLLGAHVSQHCFSAENIEAAKKKRRDAHLQP